MKQIPDVVVGNVYSAAWGQITPEEAARQIMESLNPTTWPRCTPSYGTPRARRRTRNDKDKA